MAILHTTNALIRAKCSILGNAGVGKTTIVQMFHSDGQIAPKSYSMTVNQEIKQKVMTNLAETNTNMELFLHDIAGNELFSEYIPKYVQIEGTNAFIMVFDCTNQESFDALSKWVNLAKKSRNGKLVGQVGIIVANKTDLENRRCVTTAQGQEFAKTVGFGYFESSAIGNLGQIEPFMLYISNAIQAKYEQAIIKLSTS